MNKANDCLMIGSKVFGLNSELFLHTDKKHIYSLINADKCILILNLFMFIFT